MERLKIVDDVFTFPMYWPLHLPMGDKTDWPKVVLGELIIQYSIMPNIIKHIQLGRYKIDIRLIDNKSDIYMKQR